LHHNVSGDSKRGARFAGDLARKEGHARVNIHGRRGDGSGRISAGNPPGNADPAYSSNKVIQLFENVKKQRTVCFGKVEQVAVPVWFHHDDIVSRADAEVGSARSIIPLLNAFLRFGYSSMTPPSGSAASIEAGGAATG
jgi:hypothetical protein